MRVQYVMILVRDMNRSVAFYRDTLGLPLRFESSHWSEFATDGVTVALHLSEGGALSESEHKRAGQARPGLAVTDLDAFHSQMVERGVPCLQPPKEVFGARVSQYADPDGLIISVSQIAAHE